MFDCSNFGPGDWPDLGRFIRSLASARWGPRQRVPIAELLPPGVCVLSPGSNALLSCFSEYRKFL